MLHTNSSKSILLLLLFMVMSFFPLIANSSEVNVDQMATDIDRALRSAEKIIFSGNSQEGAAILNEIAVKLEELQAADPSNKKLLSINSKFKQLQKRIGQNTPLATQSAPKLKQESGREPAASIGKNQIPEEQALSGLALIAINGITGHLDRAEKTLQSGTGDLGKTSLNRAANKYQELAKRFPDLANRPEVVAAKQRLDALVMQTDLAGTQQQADKAKGQNDQEEQNRLIEQWRKTFMAYTMPREEKYLGTHPELLDEAKNLLAEYEKTSFPLGQPPELQSSVTSFKADLERAKAEKGASGIDDQWLPRIKPLLTANDPAFISPSGPSLYQAGEIERMDGNFAAGKQLLADYDRQFPGGQSTHFLGQAIDDLKRAVQGYEQGREQAIEGQLAELRSKIERSLGLLERNTTWTAASGNPIYIINKRDMDEMADKLQAVKQIPGVSAATLAGFDSDLAKISNQDKQWREKKTAQDEAPRAFPAAGMTSLSLVAEMEKILKDRGIAPVEKLVIVDKDWWVQRGEFRYIKAAALQKDGQGPFFTHVTFKQIQTLAGYGPTELWEQGKKIRVAP